MSEHTEAAPCPSSSAQPAAVVRRRSQGELVLRRFLRHKAAVTSLVLFVAVVLLAFAGGALWRYDYADITSAVSQPPSLEHPFGTDNLGHDTFAQVLRGTQRSVEIALLIAFLAGLVGTLWGAFSGYYRGITDSVMMRIADLVLTLPLLAVAAVLTRATNGSWWFVALVIAALQWAYVSRVVRGVVLSLREKEYIEASRALGATDRWIIFRHLIPNALGPIIVNVTILVAAAILVETALSFLGLGVQPPDTSLGLLVSEADTAVSTRPWLFYFPGAFIVVIALSINFIGDGLRDAFDPTQRKARS
ncbi:ABC transporter permease [Nonomuraea sp. KC401]|uniref:ABC transporter permease n=1 Tax=unclassified Nonomuraea TaxID=2593643 RepID=UPI0010FD10C7|nr:MULTISPECIES: ABC transporter permease [unclassified Nonomuraea]NBE92649.1 ABC transporter permease subunit [Nonomuraea sp. K271]TLF84600.1 ABC transporter permease [Nonomuraea sp. KC401]